MNPRISRFVDQALTSVDSALNSPAEGETIIGTTIIGNRLLFARRVLTDETIEFDKQQITITLGGDEQQPGKKG